MRGFDSQKWRPLMSISNSHSHLGATSLQWLFPCKMGRPLLILLEKIYGNEVD